MVRSDNQPGQWSVAAYSVYVQIYDILKYIEYQILQDFYWKASRMVDTHSIQDF